MGNLSMDEDTALSDMHKKADKLYEDKKKKEAEAMKYWDEQKKIEQQKYSDEEEDGSPSKSYGHTDSDSGYKSTKGSKEVVDSSDSGISNGLEASKVWQERFSDMEDKYKEAMVSSAQLYNEKTTLIFQVESLKDRLEDVDHKMVELRADLAREQSRGNQLGHREEALVGEKDMLLKQIEFRDQFIEKHGLVLPTGEDDEEQTAIGTQEMISSEERERLLKEISELKEELSSMKSSSAVLGDQQPRDIVQVSTRMVSEYKTKLQISEAENSRLDGTVTRLKGQVERYKNQIKELEEREDELMKEKRKLSKEIRGLQTENEDSKTDTDLLKRRIEQLKRRREFTLDT
jgi:chromosome segregation ATPase